MPEHYEPVPYTGDGQPCSSQSRPKKGVTLICHLGRGHPTSRRHQAPVLIWATPGGEATTLTIYWRNSE